MITRAAQTQTRNAIVWPLCHVVQLTGMAALQMALAGHLPPMLAQGLALAAASTLAMLVLRFAFSSWRLTKSAWHAWQALLAIIGVVTVPQVLAGTFFRVQNLWPAYVSAVPGGLPTWQFIAASSAACSCKMRLSAKVPPCLPRAACCMLFACSPMHAPHGPPTAQAQVLCTHAVHLASMRRDAATHNEYVLQLLRCSCWMPRAGCPAD